MSATVQAVSLSPHHGFSKQPQSSIRLLAGLGVEGDAHCGETIQHLYLKRKNPAAPNLMQVHLIQSELFSFLADEGFTVKPGELGENITTVGVDLLSLPLGTLLLLGNEAAVELTGLRTPCKQIDDFQSGLMRKVTNRSAPPKQRGMAGVMAVVVQSGSVCPGDAVRVSRSKRSTPLEYL